MSDPRLAKATEEQLRRLGAITDPTQRDILLDCIDRGEQIPEFAWKPLPVGAALDAMRGDRETTRAIFRLRQFAARSGRTLAEFLERLAGGR